MEPVGTFEGCPVYAAPLFLLPREHPRPLREGPVDYWWTAWRRKSRQRRVPQALFSDVAFTNQDGQSQPLATRRQCSLIAGAMLHRAACEALGESPDADLRADIARLAAGPVGERKQLLRRLVVRKVNGAASGLTELGNSEFAQLAGLVATHLPIVCLCKTQAPGRGIITLSYTEAVEVHKSPFRTKLWRSVGWRSDHLTAEISELGASESNHVEVLIPEELQVNYVALKGKRYGLANVDWPELPETLTEPNICQVEAARSGNVHLKELPYSRRVGHVLVGLRVHKTKFLTGAFFVSLFTTVTLWLLAEIAPDILKSNVAETQIAGLLVIPSIVAAYIVRPGEHVLTARMLRAARYFLVANTTLAVLGALIFATTPREINSTSPGVNLGGFLTELTGVLAKQDSPANGLAGRWGVLAILSSLLTIGFFVSLWLPFPWGDTYFKMLPDEHETPVRSEQEQ
jgi:hypothetical protein